MQPSRESSVLFALDELRDIEEIRKREQREVARKQAKQRAHVLAEEQRKRTEVEAKAAQEASELNRLQTQLEQDGRSRRILEAQVAADAQTNASLQSRLRLLEAAAEVPSASLVQQDRSNRIHAAWALALVATLGAFVLLMGQRPSPKPAVISTAPTISDPAPPMSAVPVAAPECPDPAPAIAPLTEDAAPAAVHPPRKRPPRGGRGGKPKPPPPIDISGCAGDPLGCMPE
jgi:hypothetical protein